MAAHPPRKRKMPNDERKKREVRIIPTAADTTRSRREFAGTSDFGFVGTKAQRDSLRIARSRERAAAKKKKKGGGGFFNPFAFIEKVLRGL